MTFLVRSVNFDRIGRRSDNFDRIGRRSDIFDKPIPGSLLCYIHILIYLCSMVLRWVFFGRFFFKLIFELQKVGAHIERRFEK
jgi:hypothetical protein